jgi:hypothetical protein
MLARIRHAQILFRGDDPNRPIAQLLAQRLKGDTSVGNTEQMVSAVLDLFDARVSPDVKSTLVKACDQAGGVRALDDKEQASKLFVAVFTALFTSPEFQLC